MNPLIRNALATLAGWIASHVVMFSAQLLNVSLYPDLMRAVAANDPALLQAEAAKPGASGALVIGVLLTIGGVYNNLTYPPPLWFWIATPFAFLPPALLAAALAARPAP